MRNTPMILIATLGLSILFVFGVMLFRLARPPQPPFTYTQREYQSERTNGDAIGVYAPGETLIYTASLRVDRDGYPEIIRGFRTYPREQRAILCNGKNARNIHPPPEEQPAPFSFGAIGNDIEGQIQIPIPNLPPGEYLVNSSVSKKDGGETVTRVRFVITRPC